MSLSGTEFSVSSAPQWTTARTLSLSGDASGSVSWDGSANATLSVTVADDSHNHTIANVDGLQTALDAKLASSSYTASDVLTKIKTVDGASSGLDADLLDGQQGSHYLNYNNLTNKPTIPSGGVSFSGLAYGGWVNSGQPAIYSGYWGFAAMDDNSWPCMYCQISTYTAGLSDAPQTYYRFRKVYRTYS